MSGRLRRLLGSLLIFFIFLFLKIMPSSSEQLDYYVFGVVVVLTGLLSCSALYLNKTCSDDAYALLAGDEAGGGGEAEAEAEALVKAAAANKSPYDEASIVNRWLFNWLSPLLRVGYRTPLQSQHMLALPHTDRCDSVAVPFDETWRREKQKFQPKLWRAFVKSFGADFAFGGGWKVLQDLLIFAGPLVLQGLVRFFSNPTAETSTGVLLAFTLFVSATAQSLFLHKYFYDMFRVALRVRTALVVLIYKKAFVLSNASRQKNTVGEIVNHQSTDVKRISDLIPYLHVLWSSPLQIIISLILLFQVRIHLPRVGCGVAVDKTKQKPRCKQQKRKKVIGWSTLSGLAVMVALVPFNLRIAKRQAAQQKALMEAKDKRIKSMSELLTGIRVIKLFGWENAFMKRVGAVQSHNKSRTKLFHKRFRNQVREGELGALKSYLMVGTVTSTNVRCASIDRTTRQCLHSCIGRLFVVVDAAVGVARVVCDVCLVGRPAHSRSKPSFCVVLY